MHVISILLGLFVFVPSQGLPPETKTSTKSVEDAVLAVSDEMTRAAESVDADRLFSYVLENDKGSIIQNGVVLATRQEALETVKGNLRGVNRIEYRWKRRHVTVLARDLALLIAEGESVATTAAGQTFTTPFAQTVVFALKPEGWRAVHAHHSSPPAR